MLRNTIAILVTLAYPFAVYYGLGTFSPRGLALLVGVLALLRFGAMKGTVGIWWLIGAAVVILAVEISNDPLPLRLYPALVNGWMLALFAWGLAHPPTVVERFARRRNRELTPAAVAYTRRVTMTWCVFFTVNGLIALYTALWSTAAVWSLYNGVIAYILMGLLFAGEYVVRQRVMRAHRA